MNEKKWRVPALLSYAYYNNTHTLKEWSDDLDFVIDSGAFTAKSCGKEIDIDEYVKFIKEKLPKGIPYFNLDVIGDSKATYNNYLYLKKKGLNPIPVATNTKDILEQIEKYYKMTDFIGIGGIVGCENKKGFVKWVMNNGVKNRKCHWLGFCETDFIKFYKPVSCDSSSWISTRRYGEISVFTESGLVRLSKDNILNASLSVRNAVQRMGFDLGDLYVKDNWYGIWSLHQFVSTCMYVKFTNTVFKKTGTKMHLVTNSKSDFEEIIEAKKYLEKRGDI
jgi:hypothetical protein